MLQARIATGLARQCSARVTAGRVGAAVASSARAYHRQASSAGIPAANILPRHVRSLQRQYSSTPPRSAQEDAAEQIDITPDMWITVLENSASAPWVALEHTEHDTTSPEQRMRRAYQSLFQVFMYLARPQDNPEQSITDFINGAAEPGTEVDRARKAIVVMGARAFRDVLSVPSDSPLRTNHPDVFKMSEMLHGIYQKHIIDSVVPKVPEWVTFWIEAQAVMLHLGEKLGNEGFGLEEGPQQ
ncbi:hypothetical protein PLICRDRAFT_55297 [Plicaturopsis crispa FD-325 SS-3]|nr:hypothetical protein PLICRDRAFT_55297 [Plicaturopsis crispa FD-325 SS-3]